MNGKDARFVHELVNTFSNTERQLLMLYYVEQLTLLEISVILELCEDDCRKMLSALRSRTHQALQSKELAT